MKKLKNPFLLAGYYGRKHFCNREEELKTLISHLDNERNTVLYSWRRMGKTALIQCLLAEIEKKGTAECLYVDLLGSRDMSTALKEITAAVHQRFGRSSGALNTAFEKLLGNLGVKMGFDSLTGLPSFGFSFKGAEIPERSLHAIGTFLESRKKRIVIAIDEFQQVLTYSEKNGESIFRSWTQSFPGIRFIFSGSHRGLMTSMFSEKNRPFYRSAQLMPLDAIDERAYKKFIKKHFGSEGKMIEDLCIDQIYRWSRGQTYSIQLICNKLFGAYQKSGMEEVMSVCREILDQESNVFSNYTKLLTINQWKLLQAIAMEESLLYPLSFEFISKYELGAASSVSRALGMLLDTELVIKDGEKYLVHDVLLARWLQMVY